MSATDASLALIFAVWGLADMKFNHCNTPEGCLHRRPEQEAISLSFGEGTFQKKKINNEFYLRYEFDHKLGPFQPSLGLSVTDTGDVWLGFGNTLTATFAKDQLYLRSSNLAGIYRQGTGADLGSYLEFRSSLEFGYQAPSGLRVGLFTDHRSNAEISTLNPGFETLQLRVSIPLN